MKLLLLVLMLASCACNDSGGEGSATVVENITYLDSTSVQAVASFEFPSYPATNTIDSNNGTFFTTPIMNIGDQIVLVYELSQVEQLKVVDLYEYYTGQYAMGDMVVSVSDDNASWVVVNSMSYASNNLYNSGCRIRIDAQAKYVKIEMNYSGTGAFGSSPSFYVSEVRFGI